MGEERFVIRVRGLPFSADENQIVDFFNVSKKNLLYLIFGEIYFASFLYACHDNIEEMLNISSSIVFNE